MTVADITLTHRLQETSQPSSGTTATTASYSRTAGRWYLVELLVFRTASAPTPTISGTGIPSHGVDPTNSVVTIENYLWASGGGVNRRSIWYLFKATATSNSAMTITWPSGNIPETLCRMVQEAPADSLIETEPWDPANVQTFTGASVASPTLNEHAGATASNSPAIPAADRIVSFVAGNVNNATMRPELDSDKAGTTNSVDWTQLSQTASSTTRTRKTLVFWNPESVRRDLSPGYVNTAIATVGQITIVLQQKTEEPAHWGTLLKR